jgi:tRNA-modifying protein YgfZ
MPDLSLTTLDDLTVLAVRGPDAVRFLQGQLSQDITQLETRGALLAGLHNPQGRCLAVLRLLHLAPDHILVVLPTDLAESVRALLARYVLRARAKIEDAGSMWCVYGITGPDAEAAASTRVHMPMDGSGLRQLIVAPRSEALPQGEPEERNTWRLADIAAGLPEIVAATSGLFVAQMLNLDLLDAISFEKGCYTGQEVIARAHYRGQVKRRMQRFYTDSIAPLAPGQRAQLGDGRSVQVVMAAVDMENGGQQFLAVAASPNASALSTGVDAEESAGSTVSDTLRVPCMPLALPYTLP